jgi:hypothetical protein
MQVFALKHALWKKMHNFHAALRKKRVDPAYCRIRVVRISVKSSLWGADADEDVGVPSEEARLEILRAGGFFCTAGKIGRY